MTLTFCPHCKALIDPGNSYCNACGGSTQSVYSTPFNPHARSALTLSIVTAGTLQMGKFIANKADTLGVMVFFAILVVLLSAKAISMARIGISLANMERIYGRGMSISAIVVASMVMVQAVLALGLFSARGCIARVFM